MNLDKLIKLRKEHDLNQGDVADAIGVARTTYAMYEQGKRQMDYELIIKLADYYRVSLDYIFDRSSVPMHPESYTDDEIEFVTRSLKLYKEMKKKIT